MPPYVTGDEDVAAICAGVLAAVEASVAGLAGHSARQRRKGQRRKGSGSRP
jgi:hypothetical protein